jgi:TPR repeat protein
LRQAAEAGNHDAQYRLGEKYAGGEGVAQNVREAVYWLRQAVRGGVEDARKILEWLAPEILLEWELWRDEAVPEGSEDPIWRSTIRQPWTQEQLEHGQRFMDRLSQARERYQTNLRRLQSPASEEPTMRSVQ